MVLRIHYHYSETIHEDYYPVYSYASGSDPENHTSVMGVYSTDDYGLQARGAKIGSRHYHWLTENTSLMFCTGLTQDYGRQVGAFTSTFHSLNNIYNSPVIGSPQKDVLCNITRISICYSAYSTMVSTLLRGF